MVICKYYLQGICRFGDNCNYEHPVSQNNRYRYVASVNSQSLDDNNTFLALIKSDLQSLKNSNQWKLTCYSPFSNKYEPILNDEISPEEIRYAFYQAAKENRTQEAIKDFNHKGLVVIQKIDQLINQNAQTRNYLINLNEEIKQKELNTSNSSPPASTNLFANLIQKQSETQQPQQRTNLFASLVENADKPSIFSQSAGTNNFFNSLSVNNTHSNTQSSFGTQKTLSFVPQIGQNQAVPLLANFDSSISSTSFSLPPQPLQSQAPLLFATLKNQSSNTSFLSQAQSQQQQQPIQEYSLKSSNNIISQKIDSPCYSLMSNLKEHEIQEYKSAQFKLGHIPNVAPAQEFC